MDRDYDGGNPLDAMCSAIVERYHVSLHQSLPFIRHELETITADSSSPTLRQVRVSFDELARQIESHLAKEENLLFPAIEALADADRAGGGRPVLPFATVMHPIRLLEAEHFRIEFALDQLRDLARGVSEPEALSAGWLRCMSALRRLDVELHEHHRLENQLLFPAALELERRVL
jgi:regulator of cell morphogenesis and NO signaling